MIASLRFALVLAVIAGACGDDDRMGMRDGGTTRLDSGPFDAGPPPSCTGDGDCPGTYCVAASRPGAPRVCCVAVPYELCGDRIDQNCDHMDTPCGDNDSDATPACMPGQDPIGSGCDCDDSRMDVRPRVGTVAGAPEACDGVDNDCNGRTDESSMCCDACASLEPNRDRADICTTDGVCDCSTDAASGPCAEGLTCCTAGCVDVQTDFDNCGFCTAMCTAQSDNCTAGTCACGSGSPCDKAVSCVAGGCGG